MKRRRTRFGKGIGRVPAGASVTTVGYDSQGVFWYEAATPSGARGRFMFRWQAVAFANGWTPPTDAAWKPMVWSEGRPCEA